MSITFFTIGDSIYIRMKPGKKHAEYGETKTPAKKLPGKNPPDQIVLARSVDEAVKATLLTPRKKVRQKK